MTIGIARAQCALTFLIAFTLGANEAKAANDVNVLNVYNFSNYIGDDTIRNFEKETGIKVIYDTYDENEVLYAKLRTGHTGYDVVMPSVQWAKREIAGHLLAKLDRAKITTYGNLDPGILGQLSSAGGDAANDFVVPWLWGITTIGVNIDKVNNALGNLPMPKDAWDLLFKPEYSSRLGTCGISLIDTGEGVFASALRYLGYPSRSLRHDEYFAAAELLNKLRPNIRSFSSGSYVDDLAGGSLCLVLGYSGDISTAAVKAKRAKNSQRITALVPTSGALLYFDTMAIPADARHIENAYKWMSYIFRPDVQAGIVSSVYHASAVPAAKALLNEDVLHTPALFFTPSEIATLEPPGGVPDDILRLRTRLFAEFKARQ